MDRYDNSHPNDETPHCLKAITRTVMRGGIALIVAIFILWGSLSGLAAANTIVLYDGDSHTNPTDQGWSFLTNPVFGSQAVQTKIPGATRLDTMGDITNYAGYFNTSHPLSPVLDRTSGFTLTIRIKMIAETHTSTDRAGFSLIVLTNDLKGVEIGFWTNEIWVQSDQPLFTHAEATAHDTTASYTGYELAIYNDTYILAADGRTILTGPLRDYQAFGYPYTHPNFLFFGDNTSSAAAITEIAQIAYEDRALTQNGDIDGDREVTLDDAVMALQALTGYNPSGILPNYGTSGADVDQDHQIGAAEVIFILEYLSDIR